MGLGEWERENEESESLLESEKESCGDGDFCLVFGAGTFLGEGVRETSDDSLSADGDRAADIDLLTSDSLSLVDTLYSGRLWGGVRERERERLGGRGRGGLWAYTRLRPGEGETLMGLRMGLGVLCVCM